jgi:gliding motility-associated-like protein
MLIGDTTACYHHPVKNKTTLLPARIKTTMMIKKFLCVVLSIIPALVFAQYTPIVVTGFNHDVIAEGTGTSSLATTTKEMDAIVPSNFVICTQQFAASNSIPSGYGLPNNGTIISGTRTYQLAPLGNGTGTTNNALYLLQGETGLLTLSTPATYTSLSLLVLATEGNATVNITVRYTDGTTSLFLSRAVPDWVNGASPILQGFGRIKRISGPFGAGTYEQAPTNPRLYAVDITIPCNKTVASISFANTAASTTTRAFIFAVSGQAYTPPTITPTITPASCGNANGSISLSASSGTYNYSWNTTPVQTGATASSLAGGSYTCTITSSAGCTSTYTGTVASTQAFTLSATAQPATICRGSSSTLTATPSSGTISLYTWQPGNASSNPLIVSPTDTTTYKVWGTDNNGCTDTTYVTVSVNPVPTGTFTAAPAIVCSGKDTVLITYTGNAGSAATYAWNFSNAAVLSGTGAGPYKVGFDTAGNRTISLTVTEKGCPSLPVQQTIVVNASVVASFNLSADSICAGSSVNVNFNGTAFSSSVYTWNFGSGSVQSGSGAGPYVIQYASNGNSNIKLLLTNNGCSDSTSKPVVIKSLPTSSFSVAPTSVCAKDTTIITYTGNASAAATYTWNFGSAITIGTGAGPYKASYNAPGTKTVFLTVTEQGCVSTLTQQNVVIDTPVVASFALSSDTMCAGQAMTITFNGTGFSNTNYNWGFGNGTVQQGSGVGPYKVVYQNNTSNIISLSLTNKTCSSGPVNKTVFIKPMPQPAFSASPLTGCDPLPVSFTNTVETGTNYLWRFGDGNTSPAPSPQHTYSQGNYSVTLIASSGQCIDSISKTNYITVLPQPIANFTSSPGTTLPIALSLATFSFSNQSQFATTYLWNFGDGNNTTLSQPSHQYLAAGSFPVTLYASNAIGCIDSFTVQYYHVIPDTTIRIPNAFSPNNDGVNDTWIIPGMGGYPTAKVMIFNRYGQLINTSEGKYKPWDGTYNGKPLQTATYYYVIQLRADLPPLSGWLMLMK